MSNISCEQTSSWLSFLIDDESIPEQERQLLEKHFAQCERCRQQLNQLRQIDKVIKTTMDSLCQRHVSTDELGALFDQQIESETERKRIQIHFQSCEACNEAYLRLKQLGELQSTFELNIRTNLRRRSIFSWIRKISDKIGTLFSETRIWIPVAVSIFLIVFGYQIYKITSTPSTLSRLSETSPYPYIDLALRDGNSLIEQFYHQGMKYYLNKDYRIAIEKLSEVVIKDPLNNRARFYLGVCYFIENNLDKAEEHFRIVVQHEPTKEKGYWYLAQVYLKKEDKTNALKELEKVIELQQEKYSVKAKKLVKKIKKVKLQ